MGAQGAAQGEERAIVRSQAARQDAVARHDAGSARVRRFVWAALAAVVFAALLAGGVFASPAAASLDAARIDQYLADHSSPMVGTGATFVAAGQQYGVDPAFLVAISGAESSFGRFLYTVNGDQATYNAFNWFYGPTWPESDFTSWDQAIYQLAAGLSGPTYYGAGLISVVAIAPRYCPDGTQNWVDNVARFMTDLGGNPFDTRLGGLDAPVPAASPTPTPTPTSTAPAEVALSGDVTLDHRRTVAGDPVSVSFSLLGGGGQPSILQGIALYARRPGHKKIGLAADLEFILHPGESRDFAATLLPGKPGIWRGWVEVLRDGARQRLTTGPAFVLHVKKRTRADIRRQYLRDQVLSRIDHSR